MTLPPDNDGSCTNERFQSVRDSTIRSVKCKIGRLEHRAAHTRGGYIKDPRAHPSLGIEQNWTKRDCRDLFMLYVRQRCTCANSLGSDKITDTCDSNSLRMPIEDTKQFAMQYSDR